jgi:hypothetical protein
MSTFTFRFVRLDGVTLYDFKGVNHFIIASICYLVPKPTKAFDNRILNPDYDPIRSSVTPLHPTASPLQRPTTLTRTQSSTRY